MRETSIHLPVVFHFHQPVDNFEWVFEDVYKKSYEPLINHIFQFEDIKITLHFSGNLLEWFLKNKPDFIEKIKLMAERDQIEIIGGGYYEPIFAIIPYRDKIAQVKKLSELIKQEFGLNVKGAWLSERVWEPNYPSFLSDVGLEYVIVDDNHFRSTGITEEGTLYSYVTEDEGKTLRIFPINEELRYLTPWKPTYLSIEYLRKMSDEKGDRLALLISDAEKMGVWGTTHQICYVEGQGHQDGDNGKPFIPAFFEQIRNHSWIKSLTLSEYMEEFPAKDLVYLPTSSYDKMEEWVLPTDIRKNFKKIRKTLRKDDAQKETYQFLKGGFWRYFLVKYPESNNMHKKMLFVRNKLISIEERLLKVDNEDLISLILKKINNAWDEIYKAQCNDCYWHGLFGGVYLQFLRFSVYTHLINAEKIIDEINTLISPELKSYIYITQIDFNMDSKIEYLIESDILNVYINPNDAGTIFELDYKPKSYNLLNTLTRWPEAYHESKKLESKEVLVDRYRRSL
ncbi:MAG: alpha-amylase/4-alpha-glucanotransferase domain-containing protein, partial [Candidatus Thorarchaeota archaeon]